MKRQKLRGVVRLLQRGRLRALLSNGGFLTLIICTGAGMGLVAVGFQELLRATNSLFFGMVSQRDLTANLLDRPYLALLPAAGGLVVGLYGRYLVRRPPGHGVSEVVVAVELQGSRVPWTTSVHTAIAAAITIGSGGSAGPEGPIIQIGAALASGLGQLFRLPALQLRTLLACGAAAGLAGLYHAPLTGTAFAAEVLLEDLDPRTFSLLALASVVGSAVASQFQSGQVIVVPTLPTAPALDVPVDVLLGVVAAPLGVLLTLAVHGLGKRVERASLPQWLAPALGGLAVGLVGLVLPRILGSGETGIQQALGGQLAFTLLLVLPLAKLVATSLTLGSGATGGVFTPSLFIGASLGGAFGVAVHTVWHGASPVSAYALVGMGTVVAATVNAPLTAVLLVCEFTRDFSLLPEIVAAVAASVIIARQLHPESIYTLPLRVRGIDRVLLRVTPLSRIKVTDVITVTWPTITPDQTLQQALALARTSGRSVFPVVTHEGSCRGVLSIDAVTVTLAQAQATATDGAITTKLVSEVARENAPRIRLQDTLHDAALTFGATDRLLTILPVVDPTTGQYCGVLERLAILRAYSASDRLQQRTARTH